MEKLNAAIEQVEGIKREHGRYTLEEAALFIGKQTGERAEGIKNKLIAAVEKRELVTYAPGSFVKNDSKITRDFYEHVYWNALNEWLEKNEPRLDCEFPKPDAPAAKGEAVERSITKQQVINAFEGLHFTRDKWNKYLADINSAPWLKDCRVMPGIQGSKASATWNPVRIAAALIDKGIPINKLDTVFVRLKDWADEWHEASESFRD